MSRPKPTEIQVCAVLYTRGSGMMTYHIRNCIESDYKLRRLETRDVLAALKKLERVGVVIRIPSSYARQICWKLVQETP